MICAFSIPQAEESNQAFWAFIDQWRNATSSMQGDRDCWNALQRETSALLSSQMQNILEIFLGLRYYSPRLALFQQLASTQDGSIESCCWADIGGTLVRDSAHLEEELQSISRAGRSVHNPEIFPFDHEYIPLRIVLGHEGSAEFFTVSDATNLVLYAPISASCAERFDTTLRNFVEVNAGFRYFWRPIFSRSCRNVEDSGSRCLDWGVGEHLAIPGFGVEFYIKNMEYNARDDSSEASESRNDSISYPTQNVDAVDDNHSLGEIAGLDFDALIRRYPSYNESLLDVRDQILAAAALEELEVVKVWDLENIGLQTVSRISSASDPLGSLREVSQDFPSMVSYLGRYPVDETLKSSANRLSQKLPHSLSALIFDGVQLDATDFDIYQLMRMVRSEVKLLEILSEAGFHGSYGRELVLKRTSDSRRAFQQRVDLQPSEEKNEICWVTDVEKDREYMDLPRSVYSLLQPSFFGRIPSVRRNLFTAILACDTSSSLTFRALHDLHVMCSQGWPIRMGFMLLSPSETARQAGKQVATPAGKVARVIAAISSAGGGRVAVEFASRCHESFMRSGDVSQENLWKNVHGCFLDSWPFLAPVLKYETAASALEAILKGSERLGESACRILEASWYVADAAGLVSFIQGKQDLSQASLLDAALIFNGAVSRIDAEGSVRGEITGSFQIEFPEIQRLVVDNIISDGIKDMYSKILEIQDAAPRYNPRILSPSVHGSYLIDPSKQNDPSPPWQALLVGPTVGMNSLSSLPLRYFNGHSWSGDEATQRQNSPATVTHWIVVSTADSIGLTLLADAMQYNGWSSRIGILLNPYDIPFELTPIEQLVLASAVGSFGVDERISRADWADLFVSLSSEASPSNLTFDQIDKHVPEKMSSDGQSKVGDAIRLSHDEMTSIAGKHRQFVRFGLKMRRGQSAVVTNGRVVVARWPGDITLADFQLFDLNAQKNQFALSIFELLSSFNASVVNTRMSDSSHRGIADAALVASSALAVKQSGEVGFGDTAAILDILNEEKGITGNPLLLNCSSLDTSYTSVNPESGHPPPLLLQLVIDPLTKSAQQLSSFMIFLRSMLSVDIELLLNPGQEYSDLPLKTYYRFAMPEISYFGGSTEASILSRPPAATFESLPQKKTLTLEMDVPEAWLVTPVHAPQDLDNLRLEDLPPKQQYATADFKLESLLVTGMCVDLAAIEAGRREGVHPRGVQLQLRSSQSGLVFADTLIMNNLGYFQLKAVPGVWSMRLAPGRSQELFSIEAASGTSSTSQRAFSESSLQPARHPSNADDPITAPVAVSEFTGRNMMLLLRKKTEHMSEDVLDMSPTQASRSYSHTESVWSRLKSAVGGGSTRKNVLSYHADEDTIHVFTVASGHMYERLQKIMILSAVKRSSRRIKFWFIQNYMSPQMKSFLPYMAREYDFDYE